MNLQHEGQDILYTTPRCETEPAILLEALQARRGARTSYPPGSPWLALVQAPPAVVRPICDDNACVCFNSNFMLSIPDAAIFMVSLLHT